MNITFPRHGAVLCHADGHEDTDGLTVTVEGTADPLARVGVDGVPARRDASRFTADVTLRAFKTDIVARATGPRGADSHAVTVLYDKNSFRRYRLFVDDNIFFLEELARTRPRGRLHPGVRAGRVPGQPDHGPGVRGMVMKGPRSSPF